jgi:ADP-ribose pyrophosphatase YjhB (NUDIX family)
LTQKESDPRLYPAFPLIGVSIALFKADTVLLVKRAKPPLENYFSLPGGLVERGELLEDAARRELWEEVEMKAGPLTFNRHAEMIDRDAEGGIRRHFVVASFAGLWEAGAGCMNDEVKDIVWATQARLKELVLTPGLVKVIAGARQILSKKMRADNA